MLKKGDMLKSKSDIKNVIGYTLFEKGVLYEVLYIDNEQVETMVCLNHNLYSNEYNTFPLEWVSRNFKKIDK